jgi:sugar lactone lactonase YvrE
MTVGSVAAVAKAGKRGVGWPWGRCGGYLIRLARKVGDSETGGMMRDGGMVLAALLVGAGGIRGQGVRPLPGPVVTNEIPVGIQAWGFAPGRALAYGAEAGAGRLLTLDLGAGNTAGAWALDRPADRLAVSPGGRWLAAVMPTGAGDRPNEADVALVDLQGAGMRSPFPARVLPSGAVVTDDGLVVLSDAVPMRVAGYFGLIVSYDGLSGAERSFLGNAVGTGLALGAAGRSVFAGEYDMVREFALEPGTGALAFAGLSPQQSLPAAVEYTLYALPDGQRLLSRGGRLHPGTGMGAVLQTAYRFESVSADVTNRTVFALGVSRSDPADVRLFQYQAETFDLAAVYGVDPRVRQVHLVDDRLYLAGGGANATVVESIANPAAGGATNQPPAPGFAWSPEAVTTLTEVGFDASVTGDEAPGELWYRWDWDGDGRFDTDWSDRATATHRFPVAGTAAVGIEAKDRYGVVGRVTRAVVVVLAGDPGVPGAAHTPYLLPFAARDLVFLADRAAMYATDTAGKRILRVNLADGLAEREFALDKFPQGWAATPDGARLYAVLWTATRPAYTTAAYLAEFDVASGVKVREFGIDRSIDTVFAAAGSTLVGGASGREIVSYALGDGRRIQGRTVSGPFSLVRHGSGTNFYCLFGPGTAGVLDRYALDPATGQFSREGVLSGAGPIGGNLYPRADGTNTMSRAGRLLTNAVDVRLDLGLMTTVHTGWVEAVSLDAPRHALFLLGTPGTSGTKTNLYHYHSDSHLALGTNGVTNGTRYLRAYPDAVYTVAVRTNATVIQRWANPAQGGETNLAPRAAFAVVPADPTTVDAVVLDAGATADDEGAAGGLAYRWDLDGDGVFDTPFLPSPRYDHRFNLPGPVIVALEVRDRFGAVGAARRTVTVAWADDPGRVPAVGNRAFELPFSAADAVFDPVRPYLYTTDAAGGRLVRMDLATGALDREYMFAGLPNMLAISHDGRRLGVTVLRLASYATPAGPHKGFLAHFDLERGMKVGEFPTATVPHDLAVSGSGYAVVSGPGMSGVHGYRLGDGVQTYAGAPYTNLRLASHPAEGWAYGVTYGSSSVSAYRFDWGVGGALTYQAGVGGDWLSDWVGVLDTGDRMVTGVGGVFTCAAGLAEDRRFVRTLESGRVFGVAIDASRDALFVAGETFEGRPHLRYYGLRTFELAGEFDVPAQTRFVQVAGELLYTLSVGTGASVVSRQANPALGVESNQPPAAAFSWAPARPVAGEAVRFDASASTDAGEPAGQLRYRWDWDDDGVYDTDWGSAPVAVHEFAGSGTHEVGLLAADRFGAVDRVRHRVDVAYEVGRPDPRIEIPFAPAAVVFDPRRPVVYVCDAARKRVWRVALGTGELDGEIALPLAPGALAVTPDGRRLVVALVGERSADHEGSGALAEVDAETFTVVAVRDVAMDPFDVVATDAGLVVATSGSGQWTRVRSFRLATGEELGSAPAYYLGRLALHPGQRTFYVATTAVNPPSFTRFDSDPLTGQITPGGSSGSANGGVFADPDGTRLWTGAGVELVASDDPLLDLGLVQQLVEGSLWSVSFDPGRGLVFAVGEFWATGQRELWRFDGPDRVLRTRTPVAAGVGVVCAATPFVYTVEAGANRAYIQRRPHPAFELTLGWVRPGGGGRGQLQVGGWPGSGFVLESSPDAATWQVVGSYRLGDGRWLADDPLPEAAARFYRARVAE